jgi:defect in organelle trafficking protein DotC
MIKRCVLLVLLSAGLAACTPPRSAYQLSNFNTTNINDLVNLDTQNSPLTESQRFAIGDIRLQAIKDTAMSIAARGALVARYRIINKALLEQTNTLDKVFNFTSLLIDHNVLPPVLESGNQVLDAPNAETFRVADKTYTILQQARFVTTAPNWRSYLLMNFKQPELPDFTLLPKNESERVIWRRYIQKGWKNGIEQANTIYQRNLARLKRDYDGMLLYQKLLTKNMVSKPIVATTRLGVTSADGNSQMSINDKILRITALPKLNPEAQTWKANLGS